MTSQRTIESYVGLFIIASIMALVVLAFKVSGLTSFFKDEGYTVTAYFDDIGGLKMRAPVKIGGVVVGEVSTITLDPTTFKAAVTLLISKKYDMIPSDSSASILTAGLLGDNYIELTPMYSQTALKNGSEIEYTHSAMILERLVGQFLFKVGGGDGKGNASTNTAIKKAD